MFHFIDAHFIFSVDSQKNITSCTDTLEIDYTWTGCSELNITFRVTYFDTDDSVATTDSITKAFKPNVSGMYLLPLRFDLKNNTQYFYSIAAFNKSDILTDFQTGILSSKIECKRGELIVIKHLF